MRHYDTEACNLFLSCMIHDPSAVVMFAQRIDASDFPYESGLVWTAMVDCVLKDRAKPTVAEIEHRLDTTQKGLGSALDVVGVDYIKALPGLLKEHGVHSTKKASLFVERIRKATIRFLLETLHEETKTALATKVLDFDRWWADLQMHVVKAQRKFEDRGARMLSDYYNKLEPAIDAWLKGEPYMTLTTGFKSLDSVMGGGFMQGELHILGGPPGTTKTTLAMAMSLAQAKANFRVGWSSLEMLGHMLLLRAMCMEAGLDWSTLRSGGYKHQAADVGAKLERARRTIEPLPFFVDDAAGVTTETVHLLALELSMTHGIDIVYVDFAQLLSDIGDSPTDKAARVFGRSKDIAKLLDIPICVLSQVTKRTEYSETKLPAAHDIPHKGHDVAGGILLTWDLFKFYNLGQITLPTIPGIKTSDGKKIRCDQPDDIYYVYAKNRYGPEGIIKMRIDRSTGRITDPLGALSGAAF